MDVVPKDNATNSDEDPSINDFKTPKMEENPTNDDETVKMEDSSRAEDYSSENFKISIHNLPRYVDTKALKKFLTRLGLNVRKAYVVRDHAYVCFLDESNVVRALSELRNYKWKKSVLRVKRAAANVDPVLAASSKKEKLEDVEEEDDGKSVDDRLLDAVAPLHKLPYSEQLATKQSDSEQLLKEISQNVADVVDAAIPACGYFGELEQILPSPMIDDYRNKCEFSIGYDCDRRPVVGFRLTRYKAGSTEIVSPAQCPHVPPMTKRIVSIFQQFVVDSELRPYDVTHKTGFWSMLTVRQFRMDALVIVTAFPRELDRERVEGVKKSLIDLFSSASFDDGVHVTSLYFQRMVNASDSANYEFLFGTPYVYENLLGLRFRISPGAFFQVNTAACEVLYKRVIEICKADSETLVFDLCCGTGTIGIALAAKARKVIGIESCSEAVEDARINCRNNERPNCEFICAKVENAIDSLWRNASGSEFKRVVGILDPPRSGVPGKILSTIRQLAAMKLVVYVSCNPRGATKNFVDLTRRSSNRYPGEPFQLKSVQPVDMFPHTKHCEWILTFER